MMPVWNGRDDSVLGHLDDLEKFLADGIIDVKRQGGASEAEIARYAPTEIAQLRARFDQWRSEVAYALGAR